VARAHAVENMKLYREELARREALEADLETMKASVSKGIAREEALRAEVEKKREVVGLVKEAHNIDDQTHGLTFGKCKDNCKICKALAALEDK